MTVLHGVALFVAAYLLLLGRNAWKQGELAQFLRALAMVTGILAMIGGGVLAYGRLFVPDAIAAQDWRDERTTVSTAGAARDGRLIARALVRQASVRSTSLRSTLDRSAPVRLAPSSRAWLSFAPVRSAARTCRRRSDRNGSDRLR